MAITIRHAPRGITSARARALYGARRGAEQPWWDRFGASMRTAAQMYMGRQRQERGFEAAEERMRMGAEFQERAGEARLGREREMVDYRGEAAVRGIGQIGEAQRAERQRGIEYKRQKIQDAVDAGQVTPEEVQPFLDNLSRAEAGMGPAKKPPTIETEMKTRMMTDETGRTFLLQPDGKITLTAAPKAEKEPAAPRGPGDPRDEDMLKDAMKDVQQEIGREKMAAEDGYTAPSVEEQDRRVRERYDQIERLRFGLDGAAAPTAPPPQSMEAMGGVGMPGWGGPPGGPMPAAGVAAPPQVAAAPPGANVDVTDFATGEQYRVPGEQLARALKPEEGQAVMQALQQRGVSGQDAQQALFEYSAHQARMDKFQQQGDAKAIASEIRGWREYRKRVFGS